MANRLFAFETGDTNLQTKRLYAYDLSGAWTVLHTGFPAFPSTACWDGGFIYMASSAYDSGNFHSKLHRYNPIADTWTTLAGGSDVSNNPINSVVSDGNNVYGVTSSSSPIFFRYDAGIDAITILPLPGGIGAGELVWDYGTNIYIASNSGAARWSIVDQSWTVLPATPTGNTPFSTCYSNSYLYIWTQGARWRLSVPGGNAWEYLGGGGANGDLGQGQVDDTSCYVGSNAGGAFQRFNFQTGAILNAVPQPVGAQVNIPVWEIPIQAVFTFLEKDGITPQLGTEPLGGSNARYFSGQIAGPFMFTLKCAAPRQAVQLGVVPNAGVDLTANVEIAPAIGGPWSTIAQLGAFTAGQVKPYYIRFSVPQASAPALKQFSLIASSL